MQTNASTRDYTRYTITKDDRIRFLGRQWCLKKNNSEWDPDEALKWDEGVVIETVDDQLPRQTEALSYADIDRYRREKKLECEVGYFSARNAIARRRKMSIADLSPSTLFRVRMASEYLEMEEDKYETGEYFTRSDAAYAKFIAYFKAENENLIPPKTGKRAVIPGPRQFGRLVERLESNHMEPGALHPRHRGRVGRESRFTTDELHFHMEYAAKYQSSDRPPKYDCYNQMNEANDERLKEGKPAFKTPSLRSFQRIIDDLGDFNNEVGRAGDPHRVVRKFGMTRRGLQPKRPLEIVEMDEHKLDVIRLLVRNGIWDYLHPEVRRRLEEKSEKNDGRVWLSVALDAFSRSVCGMKLLWSAPSGAAAVATLAMVARDKEFEANLYGTTSSWPQCGTADAVHTDAGASYTSHEFQLACVSYTGKASIPPSKHPHLRGRVERFFRTINQRYIHLLSGQTFSNVLLRDHYDAEKHKHITDEQLAELLVMLIVDCYHNTPHRGLGGMTPLQAWKYGSQSGDGEVKLPPTDQEYAEAFSIVEKYKLGNQGIVILGLPYSNEWLQNLRKHRHDLTLSVRYNEIDVSRILVKDPFSRRWEPVDAIMDGLKGKRVLDWLGNVRFLKSVFGPGAAVGVKIAKERLMLARQFANTSKATAGVGSPVMTPALRRYWNEEVVAGFTVVEEAPTDYGENSLGHAGGDPVATTQTSKKPRNPTSPSDVEAASRTQTYDPKPTATPIVPPSPSPSPSPRRSSIVVEIRKERE
ncbi:DDE-type integrase/transposase/recombinase [Rhizobium ruizarguesonis]|uniref:DDE-type integrase/transposase/recombinase n=1 Tax=Rhizobium ruizarguesonis TaxID=2081791 RepID=UPI001030C58A|nr:DDE-type integrase/transposase/recombinase [Rhizobium ruizarguesonis]TAW77233.1 transposase [Rhizobium ruizarguesonis]TAX14197.1 transposase [Rhizobium ruizarguesonis]TAX19030.1 transposase [Rhizobium ruizarguesonis]